MPGRLSYFSGHSLLHRLHPLVKLLGLVLLSILTFSLAKPVTQLVLLAITITGYVGAGLSPRSCLPRLRGLLTFASLIFLAQLIFTREGKLLFTLPLLHWPLTDQGVLAGGIMALRFLNVIVASTLFVLTTDPAQLAQALMQAGLPYRYGFMIITALRFMPLFGSEAEAVRAAQVARGVALDRPSIFGLWEMIRYTVVPLTVASLARVESLTISMEARAFGFRKERTFRRRISFERRDWLAALIFLAAFFALLLSP